MDQAPGMSFRMRPLPRSEYYLLENIYRQVWCSNPSEAMVVLLRLMVEVVNMTDRNGQEWVRNVVNEWRLQHPTDPREYSI